MIFGSGGYNILVTTNVESCKITITTIVARATYKTSAISIYSSERFLDTQQRRMEKVTQLVESKKEEVLEKALEKLEEKKEEIDEKVDQVEESIEKAADEVAKKLEETAKPLTDIIDKLDDNPQVAMALDIIGDQFDGRELACSCFGWLVALRISRKSKATLPSKSEEIQKVEIASPSQDLKVQEERPPSSPESK